MPEYQLNTTVAHRIWAQLSPFARGYITAAMWTLTDDEGNSRDDLGLHDIADATIAQAVADCEAFTAAHRALMDETNADDERHGTDFWLTRNRHGAGFWDRGYGEVGQVLTDAAHAYGECDWYLGDDGYVWQA